jgi:hypothetical protein
MPLVGSLDIRSALDDVPHTRLDGRVLHIDGVDIFQVLVEMQARHAEQIVPPALNATIPPVISFLVYRAEESEFGPFTLSQARVTARAGVRPRAYLRSAVCDNPALAEVLAGSYGFRINDGSTALRRYHDRVDCTVSRGRRTILQASLIDPEPITGHDIQYAPGMHLAHVEHDGETRPRLVQVDSEYQFIRADRGRPRLDAFDADAWACTGIVPTEAISASYTACDVTITDVRYICNPDLPASEGTEHVGG